MVSKDHPFYEQISYLESFEGETWSRNRHVTTSNQTDLISLKECEDYSEVKTSVWKSEITTPDPWFSGL